MKTLEFFEISKLQDPDRIKDIKGGNNGGGNDGGSYSGGGTFTTFSMCPRDSTWLCEEYGDTATGNVSTTCH